MTEKPPCRRCLPAAAIGPADRALPVRKAADLVKPAVNRLALADPASPLGGYSRQYLDDLGLHRKLQGRVVLVDNSRAVLAAVRAGQADVGLIYGSDAQQAHGCRLLFRAGRGAPAVRYLAIVTSNAQAGVQTLVAFLRSNAAAERLRRCGFTTGQ